MADFFYILIITALAAAFIFVIWRRGNSTQSGSDPGILLMQNQLNELRTTIDKKLGDSATSMQEAVHRQFSQSQKLIQEITKQLTEVQETNKQVFSITDQIRSLEQVLKNQKHRGNLGEAGLELILSNILPPDAYRMQYAFKDGEIVDAVIFTKEGLIPVDAKFSLDNYTRILNEKDQDKRVLLERDFKNDLKRRINETAKYIKPKEGTLQFAFMFIPAEAIYYDLLVNQIGSVKVNTRSLIDYAYQDKNVVIVSPTTFSAYLQSVLYGFRAFRIEGSAKIIGKRVEELGRHIKSYDEYMRKLGNSLGVTVSHYNTAHKELKKIDKDVLRITKASPDAQTLETSVEPLQLDRPQQEEDDEDEG